MSAGAAAAAAEEARRRQEEEEMTPYTADELSEGWEFKILRTNMNGFRKPESLKKHLDEEGQAGWALVEKFDDNRLRLKRPAGARRGDATLDFDPYRTQVGLSDARMVFLILGIGFGVIAGVFALVAILVLTFKK
jgi:hypothetical protein